MNRRDFLKSTSALTLGAAALPFLKVLPAMASANETLVVVMGSTINSLDIHRSGTNRPSYQVAVNCYDRLMTFGTKTLEDGSLSYDYDNLKGELAESWVKPLSGMAVPSPPRTLSGHLTALSPWAAFRPHRWQLAR